MEPVPDRGRSVDRLVTFADAVVAIAITLLALPLVDLPRELADEGFGTLLGEMAAPALGFVIGFFVIARLWWSHHRIFEHVVRWNTPVVVLTVLWLFTIVLLPVATAMTTAFRPGEEPGVIAVYIGLMIVSSLLLTALSAVVLRTPALTDGADAGALARLVGSAETTVGFAIALTIGLLLPSVNYFGLFVLAFTGRFDGPIVRRLERRRPAGSRSANP